MSRASPLESPLPDGSPYQNVSACPTKAGLRARYLASEDDADKCPLRELALESQCGISRHVCLFNCSQIRLPAKSPCTVDQYLST